MNNLKKVILDTDIGDDIDDSFALLLLLESHKFNCLGVTTVFRNSLKRAKMAKQLMRSLGLVYQTHENKTLPKDIFKYTKDSICKLIAGLYDTDGSISVNTDKSQYSITLYQSNRSLLEEVQTQLYKLGIKSTISTRKAA